jgi:hypothetical protein
MPRRLDSDAPFKVMIALATCEVVEPLAPAIVQPIASRSLLPLSLTTSAGKFSNRISFAKSTKCSEVLAISRRSAKKGHYGFLFFCID